MAHCAVRCTQDSKCTTPVCSKPNTRHQQVLASAGRTSVYAVAATAGLPVGAAAAFLLGLLLTNCCCSSRCCCRRQLVYATAAAAAGAKAVVLQAGTVRRPQLPLLPCLPLLPQQQHAAAVAAIGALLCLSQQPLHLEFFGQGAGLGEDATCKHNIRICALCWVQHVATTFQWPEAGVLHTRQAPASTPNNVGAEDQPQLTNPTQEIAGYQQKYMYNSRDTRLHCLPTHRLSLLALLQCHTLITSFNSDEPLPPLRSTGVKAVPPQTLLWMSTLSLTRSHGLERWLKPHHLALGTADPASTLDVFVYGAGSVTDLQNKTWPAHGAR